MARKTYRIAVKTALDMAEYMANNTHAQLPVRGYIADRHIDDREQIELVCRIAKIMGRNVSRHGGVWYENGQTIIRNDETEL